MTTAPSGTVVHSADGNQLRLTGIIALFGLDAGRIERQQLGHLVATTAVAADGALDQDLVEPLGGDLSRLVLIRDTTSSVPGFEPLGETFVEEMQTRGMKLSSSLGFLS